MSRLYSKQRHYKVYANCGINLPPYTPAVDREMGAECEGMVKDKHLWNSLLDAGTVMGVADIEYPRTLGLNIEVPADCDLWADDDKVCIVRDKKLCPHCHHFLSIEDDDAHVCWECGIIYERR